MFDAIVSRVKSFLGAEESRETLVREPRIIPKSEHGIDPELVSWQAKRCSAGAIVRTLWAAPCAICSSA